MSDCTKNKKEYPIFYIQKPHRWYFLLQPLSGASVNNLDEFEPWLAQWAVTDPRLQPHWQPTHAGGTSDPPEGLTPGSHKKHMKHLPHHVIIYKDHLNI